MGNASIPLYEWIGRFNKTHDFEFDYSEIEIKNCHSKIKIMCRAHGAFYQTPNSHYRGAACPTCSGVPHINNEQFVKRCKLTHGEKYGYEKVVYKNSISNVLIFCKNHNDYFSQLAREHSLGQGCPECSKNKQLTTEMFIKQSQICHGKKYNYLFADYISAHKKVEIVCYEHGIFEQIARDHKNGQGCPRCANVIPINFEMFLSKAIEKHGNIYTYYKDYYINFQTKTKIYCQEHGIFFQTPTNHTHSSGCPTCGGSKKLSQEEAISNCIAVHGNKYNYSKLVYINSETNFIVICAKHGEFKKDLNHHVGGKSGCPECANKAPLTKENFSIRMQEKFGDKYLYNRTIFIKKDKPIIIGCRVHGYYSQLAKYHMSGSDCQKCALSNKSKKEINWLDQMKVSIENRNIYFKLNNKLYNVDAYDPITNFVYEFHGNYWHGNRHLDRFHPDGIHPVSKKTYGELYWKTLEKQKAIEDAGYKLIVMWEDEWNNQINFDKNINKIIKYLKRKESAIEPRS